MHYVVFSRSGYHLYYALCSIFGEWILFILCTTQYFRGVHRIYTIPTQYFRGVDTIYTINCIVFSGGGYALHNILESGFYLYYVLRSFIRDWILFIICTSKYFRGVDFIYTMYYVVF